METAKASRLPVVNFEKLIGHTSSSGSFYIYGRLEELKPGEVVPLSGFDLDKVYQKEYEDKWIPTSKHNYELGNTTDYPESFRQAYRLVRSEPVKQHDPNGFNGEYIGDLVMDPETKDLKIVAKHYIKLNTDTQESQTELWNDVDQNYIRWNDQEIKLSDLIRDFELRRR
jgi:hypothetical protein